MSLPQTGNILIIDDNPDNLHLLSTMLELHGYQVKKSVSAKLALDAVASLKPDLILLDINMPQMSGYEVCQELKSLPETKDIPVIFISVCVQVDDKIKAFKLGGVDYITKPFETEEVIARVQNQLHLHTLQKQLLDKTTQLEQVNQELKRKVNQCHQVKTALRASEAQALLLFNSNPHAMWVYDLETLAFLEVNEAAICNYGYSKTEFLAMTIADIRPEEDVPRLKQLVERNGIVKYGNFGIWRHKKKDGTIIDMEITSNAITFNNRPARIVLANDISQRLRLENFLRQQAEDLAAANRVKDEFLAIVSHELRTPLNAMLGWSSMLKNYNLDADTTTEAIDAIYRNAQTQTELINDLLNVSQMMRGKLHLQVSQVNLEGVITEAVKAVRLAAKAKDIHLQCIFPLTSTQGEGETAANLVITGDANRLQQVIWNLLSNAIKFTPEGGKVKVELLRSWESLSPSKTHEYAHIRITDTGIGIDAEFLPYVFDRFRQADSTITRSFNGMGLGLTIVRYLVELHGGTVKVESAGIGKGATFTVSLPILASLYQAYQPTVGLDLAAVPTPQCLNALRVLVVDDQADALELFTQILQQFGASVTTAASSASALEALKIFPFDVLLSDIGMPGEDGYALIRQVRKLECDRTCKIPAAAITAYATEEDRTQALLAGYQLHLAKPVSPSELVAVVASLGGRNYEL